MHYTRASPVIHELREFCEDNNLRPPGPLRSVPARRELTFWFAGDPGLEIEAAPAVRVGGESPHDHVLYLQRIVYELRYLLLEPGGAEAERGSVPDLPAAFALAQAWVGGAGLHALPEGRSIIV